MQNKMQIGQIDHVVLNIPGLYICQRFARPIDLEKKYSQPEREDLLSLLVETDARRDDQ